MSFDRRQFSNFVRGVLAEFGSKVGLNLTYSSSIELMLGTAAVESQFGTYLRQMDNGPARGVYQMEPDSLFDLYSSWIAYRAYIAEGISSFCGVDGPNILQLEGNLIYQTIVVRLNYYRKPFALPKSYDIDALAYIWKKYHNTEKGKGTIGDFLTAYNKYAL